MEKMTYAQALAIAIEVTENEEAKRILEGKYKLLTKVDVVEQRLRDEFDEKVLEILKKADKPLTVKEIASLFPRTTSYQKVVTSIKRLGEEKVKYQFLKDGQKVYSFNTADESPTAEESDSLDTEE